MEFYNPVKGSGCDVETGTRYPMRDLNVDDSYLLTRSFINPSLIVAVKQNSAKIAEATDSVDKEYHATKDNIYFGDIERRYFYDGLHSMLKEAGESHIHFCIIDGSNQVSIHPSYAETHIIKCFGDKYQMLKNAFLDTDALYSHILRSVVGARPQEIARFLSGKKIPPFTLESEFLELKGKDLKMIVDSLMPIRVRFNCDRGFDD